MPKPPVFPAAAEFGARVRKRRKELDLSLEKLAELCGVHWTYLGAIERGGRNVALRNLLRIAQALDVDLADLVRGLRAD